MTENNQEEQRERCKEARFVDENSAELIQRVTSVMAIADELRDKGMIHKEKYDYIRKEKTETEKMRTLFESLKSGGDKVKREFYYLLKKHEKHLFEDLGGVSRKRKLSGPECSVPHKRLHTESTVQDNPNYNNASNSAAIPATTNNVTNIINVGRPPCNQIVDKNEKKPPALKKEKKPPAPKKAKKPPAPKKAKKPPAPKKAKKPPARKKAKKPPAPKKAKKPPAPKKAKKPPAPKKAKKPPAPKKAKKPPAPKKAKKPPAPKKAKKPAVRK